MLWTQTHKSWGPTACMLPECVGALRECGQNVKCQLSAALGARVEVLLEQTPRPEESLLASSKRIQAKGASCVQASFRNAQMAYRSGSLCHSVVAKGCGGCNGNGCSRGIALLQQPCHCIGKGSGSCGGVNSTVLDSCGQSLQVARWHDRCQAGPHQLAHQLACIWKQTGQCGCTASQHLDKLHIGSSWMRSTTKKTTHEDP